MHYYIAIVCFACHFATYDSYFLHVRVLALTTVPYCCILNSNGLAVDWAGSQVFSSTSSFTSPQWYYVTGVIQAPSSSPTTAFQLRFYNSQLASAIGKA